MARRLRNRAAGFLLKIMSLLSDFTAACHAIAAPVIGLESIAIGAGQPVSGTLAESDFHRNYEEGGFEQSASLEFVTDLASFVAKYPNAAKSYEGNKVTARGDNWRIGSISVGASFVKISLISSNKSA
jgi:hypothetical protein